MATRALSDVTEEYPTSRAGLFRRVLSRLFQSEETLEASELQSEAREAGYRTIDSCRDRDDVRLSGTIRTVTLRPRPGAPVLEADLYDGSGTVTLIWIGRRQIPGIEPGRRIRVWGRIAMRQDRVTMYNPRYELRPEGD